MLRQARRARRFLSVMAWAFGVSGTLLPAIAHADAPKEIVSPSKLPERKAKLITQKGVVRIDIKYRDVMDANVRKKMLSGLPTVIVMRAYVFEQGQTTPMALSAKTCRIVYDLWDEVFRITITQPGGTKKSLAINLEGVFRRCGEAQKLALVERSLLAGGRQYFVAGIVEVNPLSKETLERIQRWVTRPQGGAKLGPGDSLFGSFVGLFVTRIEDSDRKLSFRTPLFFPPPESKSDESSKEKS